MRTVRRIGGFALAFALDFALGATVVAAGSAASCGCSTGQGGSAISREYALIVGAKMMTAEDLESGADEVADDSMPEMKMR